MGQENDPYAAIAKPVSADPYAAMAQRADRPAGLPAGMNLPEFPSAPNPTMQMSQLGENPSQSIGTGVARGVLKGGLSTVSNLASMGHKALNAVSPTAAESIFPSSGIQAAQMYAHPNSMAQTVGKVGEQIGEFLIPGMGEESAGAKLASLSPKIAEYAPMAGRLATQILGSGAVTSAQGGDFSKGAAAGAIGGAAGEGLRLVAPSIAETALRLRGNDRMYGRTVGRAILDDTSGVRPETVGASAKAKVAQLTPQVEQLAATAGANGARASLVPARQVTDDSIGRLNNQRAVQSASELQPISDFLKTDQLTKLPLAPAQTPLGMLQAKRGLATDFIGNWNPITGSKPALSSARQAYGAMADEFHNAVPGAAELDQRASSLLPVSKRADVVANQAGITQKSLGRIMAHSGAGLFGAAGAADGYRRGGALGAMAEGTAGIVGPEMLASPEAQMILARTANNPAFIRPAVGAVTQLFRKDQQ